MNLLLDIGNSRVKWGLMDGETLRPGGAADRGASDSALLRAIGAGLARPAGVWVCNVGGAPVAALVSEMCATLWQLAPRMVAAEAEAFGLRNCYREPARLGADRWLSMVSAVQRYGLPLCLVGCGTATTVDGVDPEGQHLGGYIIPGTVLMTRMLSEGTQLQPGTAIAGAGFGRSTEECIANGTLAATAALVDRTVERMRAVHGHALRCVVTGGAAPALLAMIEAQAVHDPDLVLAGLALMARRHEKGEDR